MINRRLRLVVLAFLVVHLWSYGSLANVLPTTARLAADYHRVLFSVASLLFMLSLAVGCLALQFAWMAARNADLARTDWLTGLLNRRGFLHAAAQLPVASGADAGPISVIAIDIDHFKQINDAHGHAAGDRVLQQLGQLLREHARPGQWLARLGGEEFCLLGVGQDLEQARDQAEGLRAACQRAPVPAGVGALTITLSAGVHQLLPGQSLEQALAQADEALYRAKREGRNRVALSTARGDSRHTVRQAANSPA